MISDPKLSTLVGASTSAASVLAASNLVLPTPTSHASRKRPAVEDASPHKYLAGAPADGDDTADKFTTSSSIQRLLSPATPAADALLSPDTEQDLADALSALAGSGGGVDDAMVVEGDCLPPVGAADWTTTADYDEDLEVRGGGGEAEDWGELVAASCDQLLTPTDDDDDTLSDAGSLTDYQRLMTATRGSDNVEGPRDELESDTMWCNWAPENDLGSLLIFGP